VSPRRRLTKAEERYVQFTALRVAFGYLFAADIVRAAEDPDREPTLLEAMLNGPPPSWRSLKFYEADH
jgi:hypothetical protein